MKHTFGIIPARSGSKRIPQKNIRLLAGKPLIAYTIEAALKSDHLERVIVSTDDKKIAAISRDYGAEVPFLRPSELAGDTTPDQPVFKHLLDWLKKHENYEPDFIVHLRPTTPFKTPQTIDAVVKAMLETDADVVRTVTAVTGVHHPYWMYRLSEDGRARPFIENVKMSDYYQRQLLPPAYRINGVVDAIKTDVIHNGNILDSKHIVGIPTSERESIDVDTAFDFQLCECLLAHNAQ